MLGTILIVLLVLFFVRALPTWKQSRSQGYFPSGGQGLLLVVVVVLLLLGGFSWSLQSHFTTPNAAIRKIAASSVNSGSKGVTALTPDRMIQLPQSGQEERTVWTILAVLMILQVLGFSLHIAGGLVHILLLATVVVLVINLIGGRRTARS